MTDQSEEQLPEPQWGASEEPNPHWGTPAAPIVMPIATGQYPYQLTDHKFTISFTPKGAPMVVVRGNSAVDVNGLLEELDAEGVYIQLAAAQQALLGSAPPAEMVMRQLGATAMSPPMASGYPAPQQNPQWNAGPPIPSAGQPPFGAPPGGYQPPQPAWGGGANQPPQRLAGWFAVKIPFNQKEAGMEPEVGEGLASGAFGLSDFIFVVGKNQVLAASVQVEAFA